MPASRDAAKAAFRRLLAMAGNRMDVLERAVVARGAELGRTPTYAEVAARLSLRAPVPSHAIQENAPCAAG